ncbi:uncharacterized protein LAESUDRAFT_667344 [Laetiporus sulphureus 93-53]|uniref:Zinc finger PHD-type domain-containing protein n=1 Tax=Laetiporus sulphureus 93-53 TaxID=1314785 RepID=A0A165AZ67_9APHY|nr:uncharacterized protein LAESUDRAFT_667344 [Laetiporus sulphureus 93-53]KZS99930.1 hypothetical protein LAESUDRAFT_667344 [Laetiporus sulphureus 93-53]
MPRRTLTPATPVPAPALVALPKDPAQLALSDPEWAANLTLLRRQWKWAAFSQFFYTFAQLLAMPDVTLVDIEDDLTRGTALYLPRVMHRLLYTLTQDRRLSLDNWQTVLRKQYMKRDPEANPIGPEPKAPTRESTLELSVPPQDSVKDGSVTDTTGDDAAVAEGLEMSNGEAKHRNESDVLLRNGDRIVEPKLEPAEDDQALKREDIVELTPPRDDGESKDWTELPMLAKLDSLHLLIEWQFQNPMRVRSIMKDDDEGAQWRIEPIGYDAKTNAYWLIGPDRLWIQRVPPKPPKGVKRKRPAIKKSNAPASTGKDDQEYESEAEVSPKRKRTQPQRAITNVRASRSRAKRAATPIAEPQENTGRRGTRAAKLQANKKLDVQARELAEFQRQAARLAAASRSSGRSARQHVQSSPTRRSKRPMLGTRTSARLRGVGDKEDDDEWQQVPEEWLKETVPAIATRSARGKGKEGESQKHIEEREVLQPPAEKLAEELKTGLESDASSSELTELSDDGEEDAEGSVDGEDVPAEPEPKPPSQPSKRQARSRKRAPDVIQDDSEKPPGRKLEETKEQEREQQLAPEDIFPIPKDFIEWESLCVTLNEWEHIAERFARATHYLEKALYKMLNQNIVPVVTAELREAERRRKIEDAIVHRKRSSRIAIKESEKEEARLAAKKKAEADEKLARARRQEAREREKEAEREKREHAREQRRLEREEREARALAKEERAQRKAQGDDRASTSTPSAPGTHSMEPVQLSSAPTTSGIQTPNWVLDCEICHKSGVNLDDGLAMVCCNICQKWQHIPCHDLADQRAGRPRRNWEVQQFYCQKCRARTMASATSHGPPSHQRYSTSQAYPSWSQATDSAMQTSKAASSPFQRDMYLQPTSDMRYVPRQPQPQPARNGMDYRYESYARQGAPAQTAYTRTQNGITFSHYQPEQRAFNTIHSSQAQLAAAQTSSWPNGFAAPGGVNGRSPEAAPFMPQYAQASTPYGGARLPTAYQARFSPR